MNYLKHAAVIAALLAVSAGVDAKPAGYEIALDKSKGKVTDLVSGKTTKTSNGKVKDGLVSFGNTLGLEEFEQGGQGGGKIKFDLFGVEEQGGISDLVKELQEQGQLGSNCAQGACAPGGPFANLGGGVPELPTALPEPGTWAVLFAAFTALLFGARLRRARVR